MRAARDSGHWSEAEARAVATLETGFEITPPGVSRVSIGITCRRCRRAWAMVRKPDGRVHGANVLRLLEHAAAHQEGGAA